MFLGRELTMLAGALVIAFLAKTYFPPPQKGSDFSRKALKTIVQFTESLSFGKGDGLANKPVHSSPIHNSNVASLKSESSLHQPSAAAHQQPVASAPAAALGPASAPASASPSTPRDNLLAAPQRNLIEGADNPANSQARRPASDDPMDTSEADKAFAEVEDGKGGAEALLALTEKLSDEFRKSTKPAAKAKSASKSKTSRKAELPDASEPSRMVAAYSPDEEERDFLKDEVGLSDQEYQVLQEERRRFKVKLKAAEDLKKTDSERAKAYKAVLMKNHKAWMQEFLGVERYRLFEDFQDQQDL